MYKLHAMTVAFIEGAWASSILVSVGIFATDIKEQIYLVYKCPLSMYYAQNGSQVSGACNMLTNIYLFLKAGILLSRYTDEKLSHKGINCKKSTRSCTLVVHVKGLIQTRARCNQLQILTGHLA